SSTTHLFSRRDVPSVEAGRESDRTTPISPALQMAANYRQQTEYVSKVYEIVSADYTALATGKPRTYTPEQLAKMMDDLTGVAGNLATMAATVQAAVVVPPLDQAVAINAWLAKSTAAQIIAFLTTHKLTALDAATLG